MKIERSCLYEAFQGSVVFGFFLAYMMRENLSMVASIRIDLQIGEDPKRRHLCLVDGKLVLYNIDASKIVGCDDPTYISREDNFKHI